MKFLIDKIQSELGQILIVTDGEKLCGLDFGDESRFMKLLQKQFKLMEFKLIELETVENPQGLSQKIGQYFAGDFNVLQEIPVNPRGTPFQQTVWSALQQIPVGTTLSYKELAIKIGKPTASRAVGMANSQNPIAIVIPCHRVIGAKTQLTGYAGGLERKQWLLHHEGARLER
ncbi:MAG: methylated-DNA--[protein]-cysteine S-methyltransferase [Microcoleaceae cyanobacterium]